MPPSLRHGWQVGGRTARRLLQRGEEDRRFCAEAQPPKLQPGRARAFDRRASRSGVRNRQEALPKAGAWRAGPADPQ